MNTKLKAILIGLALFATVAAGIFVIYSVRAPAPSATPVPTPPIFSSPLPSPSPVVPEVNVVGTDKCSLSFTVAAILTPGLNCVTKELYKDVDSNTAGVYSLTGNKLAADFTMVPGTKYIYVISYKNTGTGATDGKITDVLPAGITYVDSTDGCTYASATRTVTCTLPSVAAAATGTVAIRFVVDEGGNKTSITNSATLTPTSGDASVCKVTNSIKTPPPSGSPTASPTSSPTASLDCVAKRVYSDNANNSAGKYYLNDEIADTSTLTDGQSVVFNVLMKNTGGAAVPETQITDTLSSNLTFIDAESGCTYDSDSRTVTCVVGSLAANTETSRSFRAKIVTAGTTAVANTADVFSSNGQRDSCSVTINATGKIVTEATPAPTELPQAGVFEVTAGTLGVGVLLLLVGSIGLLLI